MGELPFERAFRRWAEERGIRWTRLQYSRPGSAGKTTAYRLAAAEAPRGVVLAVHGAGNDALFGWVGLFKRILERDYEVFTYDVEGHGRSSTTRFSPAAASHGVAEAARRSGAEERGLPLHAIGVSLGGALLLHALPTLPAASASLVVAPLHIALSRHSVRAELGLPLLRTLWREREHYGLTGLIPSFGPFKRGAYPLRLEGEPAPGAFGYVEALNEALRSMRLEEAARAVRAPVLLVYGGRDRLVPPEQGERLARLIPRAELLRLPAESHLSVPLAPAAVQGIVEWIERHRPQGTASGGPGEAEEEKRR